MDDLISREAAIKAIDDLPNCYNGYSDTYDKACIIGVLEELPTAEPTDEAVEKYCRRRNLALIDGLDLEMMRHQFLPKVAKWKPVKSEVGDWTHYYVCTKCAGVGDISMNYCPDCGARMEE